MSDTPIDFTLLDDILNKDIMPSVKMQLPQKAPMWQVFGGFKAEQDGGMTESRVNPPQVQMETFANNKINITIENGRPATDGIDVGEKFGYGSVDTDQGYLTFVTAVGAFIIPKAVLKMKNSGAIINALNFKNKSTTNALAMSLNRQCYGDATATLAYVAASGSTTKTVTLKPKATAASLYNGDIPLAVRYFRVGQKIKIGANAITTVATIAGDNSITVADNQDLVADTAVIKYNASDAVAAELDGLGKIVDDTLAYLNIDPATDVTWKAYKNTNSDTAKTYAKGDWNIPYQKANVTGKVDLIVCNMSEFNAYGNTLTDMVRAAVKDVLSGGWNGLSFMGGQANILMDGDCPDDEVLFLSSDELFKAELYPLEFEPGTLGGGQRIKQQLDYEVVMDTACNVGTSLRSAFSKLTNRVG